MIKFLSVMGIVVLVDVLSMFAYGFDNAAVAIISSVLAGAVVTLLAYNAVYK